MPLPRALGHAPHNVPITEVDVKQNTETDWSPLLGLEIAPAHDVQRVAVGCPGWPGIVQFSVSAIQSDADEVIRSDIVTLGTVGVPVHLGAPIIPSAVHQTREGVTKIPHPVILKLIGTGADDIIRTASPDHVRIKLLRKLRVEVASVRDSHTSRVHVNSPLSVLKPEVLQKEFLTDVVEPVRVALQSGTLQPRSPELEVGQTLLLLLLIIVHPDPSVTIADGAVVVLVHGPGHQVGHWHRAQGVTNVGVSLTSLLNPARANLIPASLTLTPHVDVSVLFQLLTLKLAKILSL